MYPFTETILCTVAISVTSLEYLPATNLLQDGKEKRKFTYVNNTSTNEGYKYSDYVDCQLELQKLCYAVIHISSPHYGFHNACEVIICENDIRGLFRYICARNTL